MKKLLVIFSLVLSSFSFAGPEDHIPGAVYVTKSKVPHYLMSLVFDTAVVTPDLRTLVLDARYGNFFGNFKVTNVIFKTEDDMVITAEKVLFDRSSGICDDAETAVATVKAVSNITHGIDPKSMQISVEYWSTNDNCHNHGWTETLKYELEK